MNIKSEPDLIHEQDAIRSSHADKLLFSIFDGERDVSEEIYKEVRRFSDYVSYLEESKFNAK